jgi:hypothetical protein
MLRIITNTAIRVAEGEGKHTIGGTASFPHVSKHNMAMHALGPSEAWAGE